MPKEPNIVETSSNETIAIDGAVIVRRAFLTASVFIAFFWGLYSNDGNSAMPFAFLLIFWPALLRSFRLTVLRGDLAYHRPFVAVMCVLLVCKAYSYLEIDLFDPDVEEFILIASTLGVSGLFFLKWLLVVFAFPWFKPERLAGLKAMNPLSDEELNRFLGRVPDERRWLVRNLYARSDIMRKRANIILLAINILIVGGLTSIYLAGDLVSGDAQQVTRLQQIETTITSYEERLANADEILRELQGEQRSTAIEARQLRQALYLSLGERSPALASILKELGEEANEMRGFERRELDENENRQVLRAQERRMELVDDYHARSQQIVSIQERRLSLHAALSALEKQLTSDINPFLVSAEPEPSDVSLLIASGATRFGILLVVIFLVQILVGVYRYSLRLSAFYAGRADALVTVLDRKTDLGAWGAEFLPGDIDFGRQPRTPAQYVVDAITASGGRKNQDKEKASASVSAQLG